MKSSRWFVIGFALPVLLAVSAMAAGEHGIPASPRPGLLKPRSPSIPASAPATVLAEVGRGAIPGTGGVYTTVGVGVGVGKASEPSSADQATVQTELTDKSLPSGSFTRSVAGYLYFRVPVDKALYELHFRSGQEALNLHLH